MTFENTVWKFQGMCVHVCMYVCICIYVYTHADTVDFNDILRIEYGNFKVCAYMYVCMFMVQARLLDCVHVYVVLYVNAYTYVYICIHTHTYTHIHTLQTAGSSF